MLKLAVFLVTSFVMIKNADSKSNADSRKLVELPPEKMATLIQNSVACSLELGVNPTYALKQREKAHVGRKTKKFFHCVLLRTGVIKEDGDIKVHHFLGLYPDDIDKEELRQVIKQCRQSDGEPEDRTHKFLACYKKTSPVLINFGHGEHF